MITIGAIRESRYQIADAIVEAIKAGHTVEVAGEALDTRRGHKPVDVWGNGSISFDFPARRTNGFRTDYVKADAQMPRITVDGMLLVLAAH